MKLTNHKIIQTSERKLVGAIADTLNWDAVREEIRRQFSIDDLTEITADGGNVVICDHQIAYQINIGPQAGISLLISRSGELIKISASESPDFIREKLSKSATEIEGDDSAIEDVSVMASELSDMISRINEADAAVSKLKT